MPLRFHFAPFRTHYFFLSTTLLSTIAWLLTLVSQAAATAEFGHRAVGAQWFSVLLQGFLTLGVVGTIATDSVSTNRFQLATFGAIAVVFAVQGVQLGIMDGAPHPALAVMGSGSLVLAVVDILWVLYFTSEEDSLAMHLFSRLGTGGLAPARRRRTMTQRPSIASAMGNSAHGGSVGTVQNRVGSGGGEQEAKTAEVPSGQGLSSRNGSPQALSIASFKSLMGAGLGGGAERKSYALGAGVSSEDMRTGAPELARSGTGGRSIASRKSLLSRATHAESSEEAKGPAPPMPVLESDVPDAPVPGSTANAGAPLSVNSISADEEEEPALLGKALHSYQGAPEDPNELSFAKGEILEIEDTEGKWWPAKKADGTEGIVPCNYFLLI